MKEHNVIVVLVRINRNHWILIVLVQDMKIVIVFYSLSLGLEKITEKAKAVDVFLICLQIVKKERTDLPEWTIYCPKDMPRQTTSDGNCGIYVLVWEHKILVGCDSNLNVNLIQVRMAITKLLNEQEDSCPDWPNLGRRTGQAGKLPKNSKEFKKKIEPFSELLLKGECLYLGFHSTCQFLKKFQNYMDRSFRGHLYFQ